MKLQTVYKVETLHETVLPFYTRDKEQAKIAFSEYDENYGAVNLWEITEEWNENDQDWEMIEENIIRTTSEDQMEGIL